MVVARRGAEEVEKEFPGVLVETLAYQSTRKPPGSTCALSCALRSAASAPANERLAPHRGAGFHIAHYLLAR